MLRLRHHPPVDGFGRQSVRVVLEAFNLLYHYDLRVFCSTTSPLNQAHIAPCREYLLMFPLECGHFSPIIHTWSIWEGILCFFCRLRVFCWEECFWFDEFLALWAHSQYDIAVLRFFGVTIQGCVKHSTLKKLEGLLMGDEMRDICPTWYGSWFWKGVRIWNPWPSILLMWPKPYPRNVKVAEGSWHEMVPVSMEFMVTLRSHQVHP